MTAEVKKFIGREWPKDFYKVEILIDGYERLEGLLEGLSEDSYFVTRLEAAQIIW